MIIVIVPVDGGGKQGFAIQECLHLEEITGENVSQGQVVHLLGVVVEPGARIQLHGNRARNQLQGDGETVDVHGAHRCLDLDPATACIHPLGQQLRAIPGTLDLDHQAVGQGEICGPQYRRGRIDLDPANPEARRAGIAGNCALDTRGFALLETAAGALFRLDAGGRYHSTVERPPDPYRLPLGDTAAGDILELGGAEIDSQISQHELGTCYGTHLATQRDPGLARHEGRLPLDSRGAQAVAATRETRHFHHIIDRQGGERDIVEYRTGTLDNDIDAENGKQLGVAVGTGLDPRNRPCQLVVIQHRPGGTVGAVVSHFPGDQDHHAQPQGILTANFAVDDDFCVIRVETNPVHKDAAETVDGTAAGGALAGATDTTTATRGRRGGHGDTIATATTAATGGKDQGEGTGSGHGTWREMCFHEDCSCSGCSM